MKNLTLGIISCEPLCLATDSFCSDDMECESSKPFDMWPGFGNYIR